jgi:ABC-type uncharacterized transport system substrate-binding protein
MDRRAFVTGLGAMFAVPCAARAQQAGKVWRIGQLVSSEPVGLDAFRQRLGELGYFEGQNLFIEHRNADGKTERLPALVAELVRLRADVIVTFGTQAALAAKQGTTDPYRDGYKWRRGRSRPHSELGATGGQRHRYHRQLTRTQP